MGYTTSFIGEFELDRPLEEKHREYLVAFARNRRMMRDEEHSILQDDPLREAVELPVGEEGEYFVNGRGYAGQEKDSSVIDNNKPPAKQPGLWCHWEPTENGSAIAWNETEKFYEYVAWLEYLIEHFLKPWGYILNGRVEYQGERCDDRGSIKVENNIVELW